MNTITFTKLLISILILSSSGCSLLPSVTPTLVPPSSRPGLDNPASVYCEKNGGQLILRDNADGSQTRICVLSDNTECDEMAFYRGECGPVEYFQATEIPKITNVQAIKIAVTQCNQGFLQENEVPSTSQAQLMTLQHAQDLLGADFTQGFRPLDSSVWLVSLLGSWNAVGGPTALPPKIGQTVQPTSIPGVVHLCRVVISASTGEFYGLATKASP
jgi:putative hemolysin